MKRYEVSGLKPGGFFSAPLLLGGSFVLASPEMEISEGLLTALQVWDFSEIESDGAPKEQYQGSDAKKERPFMQNDLEKIQDAELFYAQARQWTSTLLEFAITKNPLRFSDVAEKIKDMLTEITENRSFLLQVIKDLAEPDDESFLVSHAVKSAVISLVVGMSMKLPAHRLIELGVGALLHEIGMTRLPAHVYLREGELTQAERDLLQTHTKIGYDILKANNFPLPVCEPAIEHHERENGMGYPLKLRGDSIGLYSKIIAVACSYEAITAKRPHKDAQEAYKGMLELLRNEGKQYDEAVLSALVRSLSIFPIGQYVILSNGKNGQVVDTDPANPRFPIVQVFGEQTPDGKNKIVPTHPRGVHITGVLEVADMLKAKIAS